MILLRTARNLFALVGLVCVGGVVYISWWADKYSEQDSETKRGMV